jgi:predicted GNAT superfamily acetyltransferase
VLAAGQEASVRWRLNIREVMTNLLSRGYRVTSFSPTGGTDLPYYVLTSRQLA